MHFPIEPKLLAISFEPYTLQVNLVDFLVLISLFFSFFFLPFSSYKNIRKLHSERGKDLIHAWPGKAKNQSKSLELAGLVIVGETKDIAS